MNTSTPTTVKASTEFVPGSNVTSNVTSSATFDATAASRTVAVPRNLRLPARPYLVAWRWAFDRESAPLKTDEVSATTAERAIAKVKKALAEEYAEAPAAMRIISAQPND